MVKVKEIQHSDSDVSSDSGKDKQSGSYETDSYGEEGEELISDSSDGIINPWEDQAEEGEVDMDDYYGEEDGESMLDEEMEFDEDGEQEISEEVSDVSSTSEQFTVPAKKEI